MSAVAAKKSRFDLAHPVKLMAYCDCPVSSCNYRNARIGMHDPVLGNQGRSSGRNKPIKSKMSNDDHSIARAITDGINLTDGSKVAGKIAKW